MAEPKAQLVAPVGNINLPGMNATGVITATFSGTGGVVTNLTGSPDLDVGIVTGSSFIGDGTGHAASLTGTPELNLGITTATSFVGDAVGKAAGLTGTPNLNVGLITATSFVGFVTGNVTGNISGLAASVTPGVNLGVGVCTALELYGDGSALTGAGSSAFIAQEITAIGVETIIDLSDGNVIYYKGHSNTTVGFASTSPAEQITLIRDTSATYTPSFTTGAVTIDGTDDYISIPASSEYDIGTGDFTVECWMYADTLTSSGHSKRLWEVGSALADSLCIRIDSAGNAQISVDNTSVASSGDGVITTGKWIHVAACRKSSVITLYINGEVSASASNTTDIDKSADTFFIGANHADSSTSSWDGKISNFRYGTAAVYDGAFGPPFFDLTAVTGTKILCCQSDSSATAAADSPGTLTVNGTVTAGEVTISGTVDNGTITWPSSVTWNGDTVPTLITNVRSTALQVFHFTTFDTGLTYNGWEEMENDPQTTALFGMGKNTTDQGGNLGLNENISRSSPTQLSGTSWNGDSLTAGWYGAGSTKTDGTLWGWGRNTEGNLGQNNRTSYSSPVQIPGTTWSTDVGKNRFSAGITQAIKTDGSLWVWGSNWDGNLGLNQSRTQRSYASSPVQLMGDKAGFKWVSATYFGSQTAIDTAGGLWMWGSQSSGNRGDNGATPQKVSSPVQIPGNWSSFCGNSIRNSLAIKTDGSMWTWGYNNTGLLGVNNLTEYSSPIQIPGTWSSVWTGNTRMHQAAIKSGGLWMWGKNNGGCLGQNQAAAQLTGASSPVQVGTGTDWSTISLSYYGGLGLKTDGSMWGWGEADNGLMGLNSQIYYSSPVQIPGTWNSVSMGLQNGWASKITDS